MKTKCSWRHLFHIVGWTESDPFTQPVSPTLSFHQSMGHSGRRTSGPKEQTPKPPKALHAKWSEQLFVVGRLLPAIPPSWFIQLFSFFFSFFCFACCRVSLPGSLSLSVFAKTSWAIYMWVIDLLSILASKDLSKKKNTLIFFIPLCCKPHSRESDSVALSLIGTGFVMLPHHLTECVLYVLKSLRMNFTFMYLPYLLSLTMPLSALFFFSSYSECSVPVKPSLRWPDCKYC